MDAHTFFSLAHSLRSKGALVNETVPSLSRLKARVHARLGTYVCVCTSVRVSRVRLNLWFCDVCTYERAHGDADGAACV